jgi:hypothetical protein
MMPGEARKTGGRPGDDKFSQWLVLTGKSGLAVNNDLWHS